MEIYTSKALDEFIDIGTHRLSLFSSLSSLSLKMDGCRWRQNFNQCHAKFPSDVLIIQTSELNQVLSLKLCDFTL